jgi:uncharacterized membrane protein YgcG
VTPGTSGVNTPVSNDVTDAQSHPNSGAPAPTGYGGDFPGETVPGYTIVEVNMNPGDPGSSPNATQSSPSVAGSTQTQDGAGVDSHGGQQTTDAANVSGGLPPNNSQTSDLPTNSVVPGSGSEPLSGNYYTPAGAANADILIPVSCGPNYWEPNNLRAAHFDFTRMYSPRLAHLISIDLGNDNPGPTPTGIGDQHYIWNTGTMEGNLAIWPGYNHAWRYYSCLAAGLGPDGPYNTYIDGYYCHTTAGVVASGSIYCASHPYAPQELVGSCDASGKVRVSWKQDPLATHYDVRINNTANGFECANPSLTPDALGDVCTGAAHTSNAYSFDGKPGAEYSWWVYGWNSLGYGPYTLGDVFSCPATFTTPTNSGGTGTGGGNSGSGTSGGSTGGTSSGGGVACTQDAKLCPDGSSVGRVAPSCEFAACPSAGSSSSGSGSGSQSCEMEDPFDCPAGYEIYMSPSCDVFSCIRTP